MQRLCTIYIQDYLCLGFQLPLECEGGRELGWLESLGHGRGRHADRESGLMLSQADPLRKRLVSD